MMLRRMLTAAAAAASVVALAVPSASASAVSSPPSSAWRSVPLPSGLGFAVLNDLSALGPSNAFAVGQEVISNDALVLHWNGKAWSLARTTGIPSGVTLQGVDARSGRDILADGNDTTTGSNVVYRFNGSSWTSLPRPSAADPGFAPFDASFGPGGQIWAFTWVAARPAFFKLTAAGWRAYPTGVTARGFVSSPQWVNAHDAWAAGFTLGATSDTPLLLHFNGRRWSSVPAPPLPGTEVTAELNGLLATHGGQLWVSGNWQACPLGQSCPNVPFVSRRSGTRWTSERLPAAVISVSGLSPARSGQPQWMTATTSDQSSSYFAHFARGTWALVKGVAIAGQSGPRVKVVHVPGTNASWAVGWARTGPCIPCLGPVMELNGQLG